MVFYDYIYENWERCMVAWMLIILSVVSVLLGAPAYALDSFTAVANSATGEVKLTVKYDFIPQSTCGRETTHRITEQKNGGPEILLANSLSTTIYRESGTYVYRASYVKYERISSGLSYTCNTNPDVYVGSPQQVVINRENFVSNLNLRPMLGFVSPAPNVLLESGKNYSIAATAIDTDGAIASAVFYVDGVAMHQQTSFSSGVATLNWAPVNNTNKPILKVVSLRVTDNQGGESSISRTYTVTGANQASQFAGQLDLDKYEIYYGDFDKDGNVNDVFLYGKPQFLLIHNDITVPLFIDGAPSYFFYENSDHSHSDAEPQLVDLAEDWRTWAKKAVENTDFVIGDLDGDGVADILVRGRESGDAALLINGKLKTNNNELLPARMGNIDNDGRVYKPGVGWSQAPVVNKGISDRSNSLQVVSGSLTFAGGSYIYDAVNLLAPKAGTTVAADDLAPPVANLAQPSANYGQLAQADNLKVFSGEFRVDESGAATYNLPIEVPAGVAGVAPSISLSYSSQSGEGIAGMGWSLSAGGAISRCRQTLQVDGSSKPITFGPEDRFCLNGQRLVVVMGAYGKSGSVYKTEIDSFVSVEQFGEGLDPDYFIVKAKDGSTTTYGEQGISASEHKPRNLSGGVLDTGVLSWSMSSMTDSVGNSVRYFYKLDGVNGQALDVIRYAYANGSPHAEITFEYGAKKRASLSNVANREFRQNYLLTKIISRQVVAGVMNDLRQYNLQYDGGSTEFYRDEFNRLTAVTACNHDATSCLPPFRAIWGPKVNSLAPPVNSAAFRMQAAADKSASSPTWMDVNGDGMLDFAWIQEADGKTWGTLFLNGSTSRNTIADKKVQLRYAIQVRPGVFEYATFNLPDFESSALGFSDQYPGDTVSGDPYSKFRIMPFDGNADGRSDLGVWSQSEGRWYVFLSLPNPSNQLLDQWRLMYAPGFSFPFATGNLHLADFNADGLMDFYSETFSGVSVSLLTRSSFLSTNGISGFAYSQPYVASAPRQGGAPEQRQLWAQGADLNGDGRVDLVGAFSNTSPVKVENNKCVQATQVFFMLQESPSGSGVQFGARNLLDTYSKTSDQKPIPANTPGTYCENNSAGVVEDIQVTDLNRDGVQDVMWLLKDGTVKYVLGTGSGNFGPLVSSVLERPVASTLGAASAIFVGDLDEDGIPSLYAIHGSTYLAYTINPGGSFVLHANPIFDPTTTGNKTYIDISGDGKPEKIVIDHLGLQTNTSVVMKSENLIESFIVGRGIQTDINYEPLSTTPSYKKNDVQRGTAIQPGQGTCYTYTYGGVASASFPCPPTVIPQVSTADFYAYLNEPFKDLQNEDSLNLDDKIPVLEYTGAIPLVTLVTSSAPSNGDPNTLAKVSYQYSQGKIQAGGRGSLGFKYLQTTDLQTGVTTLTEYRQDWPFIGNPKSTKTYDKAKNLISESTNETRIVGLTGSNRNNIRALALSQGTKALVDVAKGGLGTVIPYVAKSTEITYDINSLAQTRKVVTETTMDIYGNTTWMKVSNYDASGVVGSKNTTSIYATATEWAALGRLQSAEVITQARGKPSVTLNSQFSYFGVDGGPGCHTATNQHRGMLCAERLNQSGVTTYHFYDAVGNKQFTASQSGGATRLSPLTVMDATGRFPEATYAVFSSPQATGSPVGDYNALASPLGKVVKTSEVVLRDKYGTPLQTHNFTSANNFTVSLVATTPMGQPYFTADSSGAWQQSLSSLNTDNCPAQTVFSTTKTQASGAVAKVCFNKIGQELSSLTKGFGGEWLAVDKQYDVLGRVTRVSEPYRLSSGVAASTEYTEYDILGRPLTVLLPYFVTDVNGNATATRASVTTSYSGLTKTTTTPGTTGSLVRKETTNALGQLVEVVEPHGTITYGYDTLGNLTSTTAAGVTTILGYDDLGRKTSMADPDKGNWVYTYNAFGDQTCQQDAKGQVTIFVPDANGRIINRTEYASGTCSTPGTQVTANAKFIYDQSPNGLGKLESEVDSVSGFAKTYAYDSLGRPTATATTFKGVNNKVETHHEKTTYDAIGRVHRIYDAARQGRDFSKNVLENRYNIHGYLSSVVDAKNPGFAYYTANAADARGNITSFRLGDGTTTIKTFSPTTGYLTNIAVSTAVATSLHTIFTPWTHTGNLASRTFTRPGQPTTTETFGYDAANRLETTTLNGVTQTTRFDARGNITSKSDVGTYLYEGPKPHGVSQVGNNTYEYDANGNMLADKLNGAVVRSFAYSTADQLTSVTAGNTRTEFSYGTDRARYKRVDTNLSNNQTTTTLYLGGVEKRYLPGDIIKWTRDIAGIGQITLNLDANGNEKSSEINYFHKDHLGSTQAITNATGTVVRSMNFDAWGARRAQQSLQPITDAERLSYYRSASPISPNSTITHRGFTGHEMLDESGIIHMNGRVYDARLARFLQADPFVQSPTSVASYNRYSYTMNNPLNATDPSGFISLSNILDPGKKLRRAFIRGAVEVFGADAVNFVGSALFTWAGGPAGSAYWTYEFSRAQGVPRNQAFKGAAIAFASAYAFSKIGDYFRGLSDINGGAANYTFGGLNLTGGQVAGQIAAHAMVGGVSSVLQGGKFGHGFFSAGITKGVMGQFTYTDKSGWAIAGRTMTAALIGGTVSEATGGKFINGAMTATMGHLLNAEGRNIRDLLAESFGFDNEADANRKVKQHEAKFKEGFQKTLSLGDLSVTGEWCAGQCFGGEIEATVEYGISISGSSGYGTKGSFGVGSDFSLYQSGGSPKDGTITTFQYLSGQLGPIGLTYNYYEWSDGSQINLELNTRYPGGAGVNGGTGVKLW